MPICARCLSNSRHRHLARVIVDTFVGSATPASIRESRPYLEPYAIFETQSDGALHAALAQLPGYLCSEYFEDVPSGQQGPGNIRCEDLHGLSFPKESFDLVITQDVLEHVRHPDRAIREITRVLKPRGVHIFTVPIRLDREETVPRVDVSGEQDRFLVPPVYHDDSIRMEGTLVYNDFGNDLLRLIDSTGMRTRPIRSTEADQERFHIFGSTVFVSEKLSPR